MAGTDGLVDSFSVECNHQEMVVTLSTMVSFHGMVYPRGLTKQSPCMNEFDVPVNKDFVYRVPLRSCNTMLTDTVSYSFFFSLLAKVPSVAWAFNRVVFAFEATNC